MFSIVITDKSGTQRQLEFGVPELSIGRLEGNDLVLPRSNVSKRHARLLLKDDRYVVMDLKSTNGTYVNGRRISAPMVVSKGDKVYIGDFIITLALSAEEQRHARSAQGAAGHIRPPEVRPRASTNQGVSAAGDDSQEQQGAEDAGLDTVMAPVSPLQANVPVPPTIVPSRPPRHPRPSAPPPPPADGAGNANSTDSTDSVGPGAKTTRHSEPPAGSDEHTTVSAAPVPNATAVSSRPPGGARRSFPPRLEDPDSGKTSPAVLSPSLRLQGALSTLMEQLGQTMDVGAAQEGPFPSEQDAALDKLIDQLAEDGVVGPDLDRRFLRESAICEAVGLGPLDRLLSNQSVREVVVDGPSRILANLGGGLSPVSSFFSTPEAMIVVARRLWARAGETLDEGRPVQTGSLPDGSQIQLLLPPLSARGPLLSVRCPAKSPVSADVLVTEGLLSPDMLYALRVAVRRRANILVSGAPGAGVSVLLSALAGLCQDHERVVTVEETVSMAIAHGQVLPLSRAGSGLGLGALLTHAMRLRYDRLVVDDVGPRDALDMLLAASTGRGVMMGMHAASAEAALQQLSLFAQREMGGPGGAGMSGLLAQAAQLVVHVETAQDGSRRVAQIAELNDDDGTPALEPLFRFEDGAFRATERAANYRRG